MRLDLTDPRCATRRCTACTCTPSPSDAACAFSRSASAMSASDKLSHWDPCAQHECLPGRPCLHCHNSVHTYPIDKRFAPFDPQRDVYFGAARRAAMQTSDAVQLDFTLHP